MEKTPEEILQDLERIMEIIHGLEADLKADRMELQLMEKEKEEEG